MVWLLLYFFGVVVCLFALASVAGWVFLCWFALGGFGLVLAVLDVVVCWF